MLANRRSRIVQATATPADKSTLHWILVTVAVVAAVVLGVLFLGYAADVLLLVFAGILLAVFLRGLSGWVSRHTPLSGGLALALVVLVLAGLLAGGLWLGGSRVAREAGVLQDQLPGAVQRLEAQVQESSWGREVLDRLPSSDALMPKWRSLLSQVTGAVSSTLGVLGSGLILLFLGLFLAAQPQLYLDGVIRLVPPTRRPRAREVLVAVGHTLRSWLLGKVLAMALIGVLTGLGLWLLHIPLALTLGVLAALLTFIPNLGPVLSAVPAVLLALVQSPTRALYVALLYLGVQAAESYLIAPLVQHRTVSIPPGLLLTAQVLAGAFLGIMGLVLATPLAAALLVLVQMLYLQDVLGDPVKVAGQRR